MKVPKKLLRSKYRRGMWKNAVKIVSNMEKTIPVSEAYVMGSFTTAKKRPADVDFIVLLKTKKRRKEKWAVDLVIVPDNKHGKSVLEDSDRWVKEKYGLAKSAMMRIR